jgi:hypothetical protein
LIFTQNRAVAAHSPAFDGVIVAIIARSVRQFINGTFRQQRTIVPGR